MDANTLHSIWTVIVFVVFFGIVFWAFSSRRNKDFEEASKLALDDNDISINQQSKGN